MMPLGSAGVFHDSVAAVGVMEDATGVATPPGADWLVVVEIEVDVTFPALLIATTAKLYSMKGRRPTT